MTKTIKVECWGMRVYEDKESYLIGSTKVRFRLDKEEQYFVSPKNIKIEIESHMTVTKVMVSYRKKIRKLVKTIDVAFPYGGQVVVNNIKIYKEAFEE